MKRSSIYDKYYKVFLALLIMGLSSPSRSAAQTDFAVTVDRLTPVWNAAAQRDTLVLFDVALHDSSYVADVAMRGLANMQINDTQALFDLSMKTKSALWYLPLTTHLLEDPLITRLLREATQTRALNEVFTVLGYQQSEIAHRYLIDQLNNIDALDRGTSDRETFALALSRTSLLFDLNANQQLDITKQAFLAESAAEQASWLYGWYRNVAVRLYPQTISFLQHELPEAWPELYGLTRQYLIAALGRNRVEWLPQLLTHSYLQHIHPLEAIEITRIIPAITNQNEQIRLLRLLFQHENAMVRTQAYLALARLDNDLSAMVPEPEFNAPIQEKLAYYAYQLSLAHVDIPFCMKISSQALLDAIAESPSVTEAYLPLLHSCKEQVDFYTTLNKILDSAQGASIINRFVLHFLTMHTDDSSVYFNILERIAKDEAAQLHVSWMAFADATVDIHHDSAILANRVNLAREREQMRSEVLLHADPTTLKYLGDAPVWIITTQRGTLHLRLDPLRSPSTVTAIALLTQGESHKGSPFHRVVPNFVVQAGELWNDRNGSSPHFRIPTEASEKSFHRGGLGIASAGRDTEGSQFFIMHMWAPHLDGRYTHVGYLIEGYDVLDGLLQGDVILNLRLVPTPR